MYFKITKVKINVTGRQKLVTLAKVIGHWERD